jgi:hypothetical protein
MAQISGTVRSLKREFQDSGDHHIVDLGIQACAGSLSVNLYCAAACGVCGLVLITKAQLARWWSTKQKLKGLGH